MVAGGFMQRITFVVVISAVQRVKAQNSGKEFGAILEVEDGLKTQIKPSPLEISLEDISNKMWKSKNELMYQIL